MSSIMSLKSENRQSMILSESHTKFNHVETFETNFQIKSRKKDESIVNEEESEFGKPI